MSEAALEELSEHLGYDKHDPVGRNGENSRFGTRTKTALTGIGPVASGVPRDRDGAFGPVIVEERQRRLDGVDQIVLSLTARGLTTGEVAAHFADVYGATISKDTLSRRAQKATGDLSSSDARTVQGQANGWAGPLSIIGVVWGQRRSKEHISAPGT